MADDVIPLKLIHESTTNPRKYFNEAKLLQLATSIAVEGVKQRILVRPHPSIRGHYELVIGHRRTRACLSLGFSTIPGEVKELDDRQVFDAQMAENMGREDLHPMEEAHAYNRCWEEFQEPVEVIAEKYGLSPATVARRLALVNLREEVERAFLDDELTVGVAELLARIPRAFQVAAMNDVRHAGSTQAARAIIERKYMLRLAEAPFGTGDATLVSAAGTCADCCKRTGNDRNLFGDVEGPDVCTDPECYDQKVDVFWQRTTATADADGVRVLPAAEVKKVLQYGAVNPKSPYVAVHDRCWDDPKQRSYKQLLGPKARVVLAREGNKVVALLRRDEIHEQLGEAGHNFARSATKRQREEKHTDQHAERDRERSRQRRVVVGLTIAAVVQHAELVSDPERVTALWRTLLHHLVSATWADVAADVARRRGLPTGKKERPADALQAAVAVMDVPQLRGLAVEFIATRFAYVGVGSALEDFRALFGIDEAAIESVAGGAR